MNDREIRIDRLEIRLAKGTRKLSARHVAEGLGREILKKISDARITAAGAVRIDKLNAGKIKMQGTQSVAGLQREIAGKVLSEVGKSLRTRSGK